jgi:polysaccharide biosynthesis protein PslG
MVALAVALAAVAIAPPSSAKAAAVPQGFVGTMIDGPLWPNPDQTVDLAGQLDHMVASGVQSIRLTFDWASAQPYKSWKQVPAADKSQFVDVGGVPTNFSDFDQIVGMTSQRGLALLPVILNAPAWDGVSYKKISIVDIPRKDGPYATFVAALVRRYGPTGTFWQDHAPRMPIRMWQIWNEPNIIGFWPPQPFEPRYIGLLRAARTAIKDVDPGAKIVLAGMPNFSWLHLAKLYGLHAGPLFDIVAIHPYTRDPAGVITILEKDRQVMNAAGDRRKPLIADEISWPSSKGKTIHNVGLDFATTEAGQARNLAKLLPMLGADRRALRLLGFYYYTWAGSEHHNGLSFDFSGLFRFKNDKFIAKPAFFVFRHDALALEHCRRKGPVATSCAQPG